MRTSKFITATALISAVMLLSSGFAVAGPPQDPGSNGNGLVAAGVERHQFTDWTFTVDSVNNGGQYDHVFSIRYNPCTGEYSGSGEYVGANGPWDEAVSDIEIDASNVISFKAVYQSPAPNAGYTWYPAFDLGTSPGLEFVDVAGDNVVAATGTWSSSQTSYNHGEYVAESINESGPNAHSCIGMPIVSKGKTK